MLRLLAVSFLAAFMMFGCASKDKTASEEAKAEQEAQAESKEEKAAEEKKAEESATKGEGQVVCTLAKDKRIIEVVSTGEKSCEVLYTKYDNQQSIASAQADPGHCEKVQERVKTNLENAGFKCE